MISQKSSSPDSTIILNWLSTFVAVTVILAQILIPDIFEKYLSAPTIILCITIFGIPHGAVDHFLYYQFEREQTTGKNENSRIQRVLFYTYYLGIMSIWGLLWLYWKIGTFWAFLFVSAYHFGQGDLDYLEIDLLYAQLTYLSRGFMILGALFGVDPSVTLPIVDEILGFTTEILEFSKFAQPLIILSTSQHFIILAIHLVSSLMGTEKQPSAIVSYPMRKKIPDTQVWLEEMCKSSLILALLLTTNPLVSFSVYWGMFHSLGSILEEIKFLKYTKSPDCSQWTALSSRRSSVSSPIPIGMVDEGDRDETSKLLKSRTNSSLDLTDRDKLSASFKDLFHLYYLAAPYTIVAETGIFMVYIIWVLLNAGNLGSDSWKEFLQPTHMWTVFVITISMLTGPHMWVFYKLHSLNSSN